jgi:hypothetical protein
VGELHDIWLYLKDKDWLEILIVSLLLGEVAELAAPFMKDRLIRMYPPTVQAEALSYDFRRTQWYVENDRRLRAYSLQMLTLIVWGTMVGMIMLMFAVYMPFDPQYILRVVFVAIGGMVLVATMKIAVETYRLLYKVSHYEEYAHGVKRRLEGLGQTLDARAVPSDKQPRQPQSIGQT